jgi:hypothetical protein
MSKTQLEAKQFPIFSYEDYDFEFKKRGYPIGLKSTYPEELVQRVSAARLSYLLRLKSVDYTLKQYLNEVKYEMGDGSRLDLRVSATLKHRTELLSALISRLSERPNKSNGEAIGEWTLLRVPFATKILLSCANRGALFESVAIARMLIEQVAWATKVNGLDDILEIQNTSATKAVAHLKTLCPSAGRLYGWLSSHAHWTYEGHVKAMEFDEHRMIALFATSKFKRKALALSLVMVSIVTQAFLVSKKAIVDDFFQNSVENNPFEFEFDDERFCRPEISELKNLINQTVLSILMKELIKCGDHDDDVEALSQMMPQMQE